MQVLNLKALADFSAKHADVCDNLDAWLSEVTHSAWKTPAEVKSGYPAADLLSDNRLIFNIKGNHYRLLVRIHYELSTVRILRIGTHCEYDT